ncbi:hypothetical protein K458DRAFT_390332 [Lentithecium fluviatile CBS 122367]|uniref:Uncharacterized protein n=1 Tax=Lentithecium fluviatile CBS 122367 TaxID=1168545 RepID=A0A6G1IXT2_9PLEO|nr:hypothetical protein K458DRAFT_390332 [Lentithecium fluviatile CBS 122367]
MREQTRLGLRGTLTREVGRRQYWFTNSSDSKLLPDADEQTYLSRTSISTYNTCSPSYRWCSRVIFPQHHQQGAYHSPHRNQSHKIRATLYIFSSAVSALGASSPVRHHFHFPTNLSRQKDTNLDLACLLGFVVSSGCFYRLFEEDDYQDLFLVYGFFYGMVFALFYFELGLQDSLFDVLPWGILLSLLLSRSIH